MCDDETSLSVKQVSSESESGSENNYRSAVGNTGNHDDSGISKNKGRSCHEDGEKSFGDYCSMQVANEEETGWRTHQTGSGQGSYSEQTGNKETQTAAECYPLEPLNYQLKTRLLSPAHNETTPSFADSNENPGAVELPPESAAEQDRSSLETHGRNTDQMNHTQPPKVQCNSDRDDRRRHVDGRKSPLETLLSLKTVREQVLYLTQLCVNNPDISFIEHSIRSSRLSQKDKQILLETIEQSRRGCVVRNDRDLKKYNGPKKTGDQFEIN